MASYDFSMDGYTSTDDYISRKMCKPCPFCGEIAQLKDIHILFIKRWSIQCTNTSCKCKIGNYKTPIIAIRAWNKRKEI